MKVNKAEKGAGTRPSKRYMLLIIYDGANVAFSRKEIRFFKSRLFIEIDEYNRMEDINLLIKILEEKFARSYDPEDTEYFLFDTDKMLNRIPAIHSL